MQVQNFMEQIDIIYTMMSENHMFEFNGRLHFIEMVLKKTMLMNNNIVLYLKKVETTKATVVIRD